MTDFSHNKQSESPAYLLNQMPPGIEDIPGWFDTLTDDQFDSVCCATVISAIIEGSIDGVEVPLPVVRTLIVAMRDRYRKMKTKGMPKKKIDKLQRMRAA